MKEIATLKFKATCLAVLRARAQDRGTNSCDRFGHPVRKSSGRSRKKIRLGGGAGTAVILGDIVADWDISEWEAAQDQRQSMQRRPATRNDCCWTRTSDLELLEPHKISSEVSAN